LITILLLGGLYDTVNASSAAKTGNKILKKTTETGKEIVGRAADVLNEISGGINDNPESKSNGVQNSNSPILLEVPPLNESATDRVVDNPDMIATKMKFGDKQNLGLGMLMYGLKDQNFVVSNNSRICPDQKCKFQFKDTDLVYQPN
jgi:hypothetical protein